EIFLERNFLFAPTSRLIVLLVPPMSVPVAWVVGLMVALEPSAPWRGTYEKTAEAIARVSESDPLFEDKGEERTAAMLVALAWYDSRFKSNAKRANRHSH